MNDMKYVYSEACMQPEVNFFFMPFPIMDNICKTNVIWFFPSLVIQLLLILFLTPAPLLSGVMLDGAYDGQKSLFAPPFSLFLFVFVLRRFKCIAFCVLKLWLLSILQHYNVARKPVFNVVNTSYLLTNLSYSPFKKNLYIKWRHSDLNGHDTISMLWGNMAYCVNVSGEDVSRYWDKIASAGLRNRVHDH